MKVLTAIHEKMFKSAAYDGLNASYDILMKRFDETQRQLDATEKKLLEAEAENAELKKKYEDALFNEEHEHILATKLLTIKDVLSKPEMMQAIVNKDYERAYEIAQPDCDCEGYELFDAAATYTSIKSKHIYRHFPAEDNLGRFEKANGFDMLGWLEVMAFGSCDWEIYSSCYEISTNHTINKDTEEYKKYRRNICGAALHSIFGLHIEDIDYVRD